MEQGGGPGSRHPAALELGHDPLHDAGDLLGVDAGAGGAAADGLLGKALGGQQALELLGELVQRDLLRGGLRLPAAPGNKGRAMPDTAPMKSQPAAASAKAMPRPWVPIAK